MSDRFNDNFDDEMDYLEEDDITSVFKDMLNDPQYPEESIYINIPDKINQLSLVYKAMQKIISGDNLKIYHQINKPFIGIGSVRIVGNNITISRPDIFALAIKVATNFEICSRTNNLTEINFGFNHISRRVK